MYILVNPVQLKKRSGMYETMPDGRSIVPLSDQKILGTLKNVDIIATARELKQLIEEEKKQQEGTDGDIDPDFSRDPDKTTDDIDPGFSRDPSEGTGDNGSSEDGEKEEGKEDTDSGSESEETDKQEKEVING